MNCFVKMTFRCQASKAIQKIATDQKDYHKCSFCVIICCIAKIYLSVNNSEKRLVTRTPPTELKKLQKLHQKRSNNWSMVSFIYKMELR